MAQTKNQKRQKALAKLKEELDALPLYQRNQSRRKRMEQEIANLQRSLQGTTT